MGTDTYAIHDPASLGLDPAAVEALLERAHREIEAGLLPSCQIALARDGKLALFETLGDAEPESRYTMFSCTKGFVAGAVWLLVGEGRLSFDEKVVELLPEFGTNGKDVITVEQLLTHTSGFPTAPLDLVRARDRDARVQRFGDWRLNWEPGTKFQYHPTAAHWVLAELVGRASGTDYRRVIEERITAPLGLTHFALGPDPDHQDHINDLVTVGDVPDADELTAVFGRPIDLAAMRGEVTEDALLEFNKPEVRAIGVPGGGGIATAADLALYYQGVLHDPAGIWPAEHLAWAEEVRNDLPDPIFGTPAHRSLGLMVAGDPPGAQRRAFGHGCSPRTFGHDGAAGQVAWVDPDSGISFGYMTNGNDQNFIRQARRTIGLSSKAATTLAE
jgi:CubicO group peptidase (beta-lactamase class C family)